MPQPKIKCKFLELEHLPKITTHLVQKFDFKFQQKLYLESHFYLKAPKVAALKKIKMACKIFI